jgi:hypothetical protein
MREEEEENKQLEKMLKVLYCASTQRSEHPITNCRMRSKFQVCYKLTLRCSYAVSLTAAVYTVLSRWHHKQKSRGFQIRDLASYSSKADMFTRIIFVGFVHRT